MLRLPGLVLVCIATTVIFASEDTTVYKSQDKHGNPVFTDRGSSASEEIKIEDPITYPSEAFKEDEQSFDYQNMKSEADESEEIIYDNLFITSPADQETIRENAGNITVVGTFPARLAPGHQLRLLMDGQPVGVYNGSNFHLKNIDRGSHKLQLQIVDKKSGEVIIEGGSISFTILRHSALFRNKVTPHKS